MHTIAVDMRRPVLTVPERKLSYQFMAAEAHWMLMGSNRVDDVAPWNKRIAEFSDDGVTFFGAYGPKILAQLDYVVTKLLEDPDSRQAGLTLWRENPPVTRDCPCTVAMFFSIRRPTSTFVRRVLEMNVFMRSNDAWLGTPYDAFNFSMVGHLVCARLNAAFSDPPEVGPIVPGTLRLTAASSHLYEPNWEEAGALAKPETSVEQASTPEVLFNDASALRTMLKELRDTKPGDPLRWWERR